MFSKVKSSIQKAGKEVKGGFEKAGNSIKKSVEGANRSLVESRSRHSSVEKKGDRKASTATGLDGTPEKAHAAAASTKKPEQASAASTPVSTQEAPPSVSLPPSVHSDKLSTLSLRKQAAPAEAPAVPRSRARTPNPSPPPLIETPKRAGDETLLGTPPATAATPEAFEAPPKNSSTPSVTSGNSLHFSDTDEMQTPGSIRFTEEPGSALRKLSSPRAKGSKGSSVVPVEEVAGNGNDDKAADLTAESSLDLAVEEDDVQSKEEHFGEKPTPATVGTNGADKTRQHATEAREEVSPPGRKHVTAAPGSRASPSTAAATTPAAAPSEVVTVTAAKEKSDKCQKIAPLRTRVSGTNSRSAAKGPAPKSLSSRGGGRSKAGVHFADDGLEHPPVKVVDGGWGSRKRLGRKGVRPVDFEDRDNESDGEEAARAASSSHSRNPSSSNSEGDEVESVDAPREKVHAQRWRRGFRLSPADEGRASNGVNARGKARRPAGEVHPAMDGAASLAASREKSRGSRPRNEERLHVYAGSSAGARELPQTRNASRASLQHDRYNEFSKHGEDCRRHRGIRETLSSAYLSPVRTLGSAHSFPVHDLDGSAIVGECLRDTQGYLPRSVRHRTSPRSWRSDNCDGETLQRRSVVQSTYQHDYPNWRRYREEGSGDDDDAVLASSGCPSSRYEQDAQRSSLGRARQSSPRRAPARLSSSQRLSFYDEDDALAAEAVAEPERFRAHSAARCHSRSGRPQDGYGSGGEEVVPRGAGSSRSLSSIHSVEGDDWHDRRRHRRAYDVVGRRPSESSGDYATSHYALNRGSERKATPLSSCRHRYDAPHLRSPPRRSTSLHRLTDDRADPDYYFSDTPRRRRDGGSRRSRSRGSTFASSPPRSPLWAQRSAFGRPTLEVSRCLDRPQRERGGPTTDPSPLRSYRAATARRVHDTRVTRDSSTRRVSRIRPDSVLSEEEILDEVEWKLDVLGHQIVEEDQHRERAMMSSPFERLYHLNNRRDRDERRQKVFQLNRLERIRDRIVSGSLQEDILRREERLRKQEEMLMSADGVFSRLYQSNSSRRSRTGQSTVDESSRPSTPHQSTAAKGAIAADAASPNATRVSKASSRLSSATRRTLSSAQRVAMCDRLYGGALEEKNKKEERTRQSAEERRQREVEELLVARLVAQLQLQHAHLHPRDKKPPLGLDELQQEARRELEKMRDEDPKGYKDKLLRGRVLSTKEQGLLSNRLWIHGYVPKEKLEARKARDELRGCTFHPEVNDYAPFNGTKTKRVKERDGKQSEEEKQQRSSSSEAAHHVRREETDRCKELYRKGMKAKAREAELRNERDREARMRILRGRMANDHHFRRRVELDPSLADRFLKSLVV
ncbi:hypothetical protein ABL78_5161 [Leptomonas seymouri]|uniref:Uncharacterized protein n=1 Tax=Leptomonas seymouri TaxID=5684 RepID=A0A0N1PB44_LEPSE|nr:hypothetical protein ABL78_5161 [Leptomonas seymouri]|eukprot:KPI85770.1 hypothetical protein ABL78_5161 [Leptomonas seymouri]